MKRTKNNNKNEFLWVEKYRPRTLSDCILPDELSSKLDKFVANGDFPNLMLSGTQGTGKTTVARALCNDLNMDVLVINASKDGNIDTLRTTIQNFAMNRSFESKRKCVILDEADYLNANSTQPALRNFIEEFSKTCRFIFTCNHPSRIIEPLHSRLAEINFSHSKADQRIMAKHFLARLCHILDSETVEYDKATIAQLILKYTPDYRKMINVLQNVTTGGELESKAIGNLDVTEFENLAKMIKERKFTDCRKWIAENSDVGFEHFMKVKTPLQKLLVKSSIPDMFIMLNEFDRGRKDASDMEVHMTACIANLMFDLEYE